MTAKEQGFTLAEVAAFLDGSAPLDGVWFGEIHRELPGKFWWRKHLRAALASDTGERGVILPESLVALARRCLHIAFVWNDHNFPAAHKMAREEATRWGIGSMDDANSWLDAPEEWPVSDALRAQPAGGGEDWQARALSAEADIERMTDAFNRENGPTFMGEPVLPPEKMVELEPGVRVPKWLLDDTRRVELYMKANLPGPWRIGGIQSHDYKKEIDHD